MRPPRKILVGNYDVTVVERSDIDMDEMKKDGHFSGRYSQIGIREMSSFLDSMQRRDVMLHECLHAMFYFHGLSTALGEDFTDELEEQLVSGLAPALLALLRRNPRLVAYLLET